MRWNHNRDPNTGRFATLSVSQEKERMEHYKEGLNDTEIGKRVGRSHETIYYWRKVRDLKPNCPQSQIKNISLRPTRELGYLCGLILGDGSIYKREKTRNYLIFLGTTKEEFAGIIIDAMRRVGLNPGLYKIMQTRRFPNGEIRTGLMYHIFANSKVIYEALSPYKKPRDLWEVPKFLTTDESIVGFLQGIYDAEGGAVNQIDPHSYSVALYSKHKFSLEQIDYLLRRFCITPTNIYRCGGGWRLVIARKPDRKNFADLIGFRLAHKRKKLLEGLGYNCQHVWAG